MSLNIFAFIGHGEMYDNTDSMFMMIGLKDGQTDPEIIPLNIEDLAHEFAAIPNTLNIFLYIACRNKAKKQLKEDQ